MNHDPKNISDPPPLHPANTRIIEDNKGEEKEPKDQSFGIVQFRWFLWLSDFKIKKQPPLFVTYTLQNTEILFSAYSNSEQGWFRAIVKGPTVLGLEPPTMVNNQEP